MKVKIDWGVYVMRDPCEKSHVTIIGSDRMPSTRVNKKHLYNICTMSGQRWKRWADVVQMLYKCFVFAWVCKYDSRAGRWDVQFRIMMTKPSLYTNGMYKLDNCHIFTFSSWYLSLHIIPWKSRYIRQHWFFPL